MPRKTAAEKKAEEEAAAKAAEEKAAAEAAAAKAAEEEAAAKAKDDEAKKAAESNDPQESSRKAILVRCAQGERFCRAGVCFGPEFVPVTDYTDEQLEAWEAEPNLVVDK